MASNESVRTDDTENIQVSCFLLNLSYFYWIRANKEKKNVIKSFFAKFPTGLSNWVNDKMQQFSKHIKTKAKALLWGMKQHWSVV